MGYKHRNKREGFWASETNPKLPVPVPLPEPWEGKEEFVEKLFELEVSNTDCRKIPYKGFSYCRICGKVNGTMTNEAMGWEWPTGYRHYIEEHNVRPSLAFQEMVLGDYLGE